MVKYNAEIWKKLYGERNIPWSGAKEIVEVLIALTDANSVLDVGCGRGDFLYYFEQEVKFVAGIDNSDWIVENKFCNSPIILSSCDHLPFEDNSFELVLALDLFEHLRMEQLQKTLLEISRVSSESVFLLISSIEYSEGEGYIERTQDLAGHIIYKFEDWWLRECWDYLKEKFFLDVRKTIYFTTILNRKSALPFQWRHYQFWTKK